MIHFFPPLIFLSIVYLISFVFVKISLKSNFDEYFRSINKFALSAALFFFTIYVILSLFLKYVEFDLELNLVILVINLLLFLSNIDVYLMKIPTTVVLILSLTSALINILIYFNLISSSNVFSTNVLENAVTGFVMYFLVRFLIFITDKKGIGEGDADLVGILSSIFGLIGILSIIIYGTAICLLFILIYKIFLQRNLNLKTAVPFVPVIYTGVLVYLILGKEFLLVAYP